MDLPKAVSGKVLLYANSGGGKSWAIRYLLEQSFTKIPHIILDTEGEFATLREKYDYILIGKGYDIAADPKTAALMALRLWESRVSAVIDLFELSPEQRQVFVKNFVDAMVNAPKNLWKPVILVIDEAHEYAPENGHSETGRSLHLLASKGRKRMIGPVFATTRLSLLSKNVVAACKNKFIGQSSLESDMKRASFEIGFTTREQIVSLRDLDPGEFYAFGPAISKTVTKMKFGAVKTSHGDATYASSTVAPASEKVKRALAKLADLPQAAAEEAKTTQELKMALSSAKRRITELERAPKVVNMTREEAEKQTSHIVEKALSKKDKEIAMFKSKLYQELLRSHGDAVKALERLGLSIEKVKESVPEIRTFMSGATAFPPQVKIEMRSKPMDVQSVKIVGMRDIVPKKRSIEDTGKLGKGEEVVLNTIAQYPNGISTEHIAVITGYKATSRRTYLQILKQKGFIRQEGELYIAEPSGVSALGDSFKELPTGKALQDHVMTTLPEGERKVLQVLLECYPNSISFSDIEVATNYKPTSRRTYLQKLGARKLAEVSAGTAKASDKLFD